MTCAAFQCRCSRSFLQVILGWLTADGAVHERVATRRVRATLSPAAYLASVDAPAAALLLGKRVVLEAARTGAWADRAVCGQLRAAIGADSILTLLMCTGTDV